MASGFMSARALWTTSLGRDAVGPRFVIVFIAGFSLTFRSPGERDRRLDGGDLALDECQCRRPDRDGSGARSAADVVRVRKVHPRGHDDDGLTGLEPCEIGRSQGERVVVRCRALDAVGLVGERTEVRDRYVEGVAVVAGEIEAAATAGRLRLCGAVAAAAT